MRDLISRQAAIDVLMAWEEDSIWDEECLKHRGEPYWVAPSDVIEKLPSVQPERKRGKWIRGKCGQCGAHAPFWPMASTYYESDYCPNCGADMRGDNHETD